MIPESEERQPTPAAESGGEPQGATKRRRRRRPRRRRKTPVAPAIGAPAEQSEEIAEGVVADAMEQEPAPGTGETSEGETAPTDSAPGVQRRPRRRRGGRGRGRKRPGEQAAPSAPDSGQACPEPEHRESTGEVLAKLNLKPLGGSPNAKLLKVPGLDAPRARTLLVAFIQEQMERFGARRAVIGLSGGLDSAVTAALLIETLGRDRVHLLHVHESGTDDQDQARAEEAARQWKADLDVLRRSLSASRGPAGDVPARRARERMIDLYTIAEAEGALVAGSLNKSKWLLGQGIEHGDLAYAFNPLGGLYRTQVVELARHLGVPRSILDHALRHVGLEDASLGIRLTWEDIDQYLYPMVDARLSLSHLQTAGIPDAALRWLYRRLRDSAHKRSVPVLADVSAATVMRAPESRLR